MKLQIIGENFEVTDRIKKLVEEKIEKNLEKYLQTFNEDMKTATIKIEKGPRWGYWVNFNMWLPLKKQIYAQAHGKNLISVLVALREKIRRQIKSEFEK